MRLGRGALLDIVPVAERRHVQAEGHVARASEEGTEGAQEVGATIHQLARPDLVPAAMRVPIQDRGLAATASLRTREKRPDRPDPLEVEGESLEDIAVALADLRREEL